MSGAASLHSPDHGRTRATWRPVQVWCAILVVTGCVLCGLLASSAAAQNLPAQMSVTVIAPSGSDGPAPTGDITVSVDGRKVATVPLTSVTNPITAVTPLISGALNLLGKEVTITYSGDSNYEASEGATVTFPSATGLTIVPKLK